MEALETETEKEIISLQKETALSFKELQKKERRFEKMQNIEDFKQHNQYILDRKEKKIEERNIERENVREDKRILIEKNKIVKAKQLENKKNKLANKKAEKEKLVASRKRKAEKEKLTISKNKETTRIFALEMAKIKLLEAKTAKENVKKREVIILKKWQDNAFLRGKAAWNDMYGSALDRTKKYRYTTIVLSIALVISTFGLIVMGTQSKIQPYIVNVGQNGNIVDINSAQKAPTITTKIIKYFLQKFIINLRSVSGDNIIEKARLAEVYASVNTVGNSNALNIVKGYITENNPFVINSKFTNEVNIQTILAVGNNIYQITWEEIKRTTGGNVVSTNYYTGQISYDLEQTSDKNFQYNPFGVFITAISWSKVQIS